MLMTKKKVPSICFVFSLLVLVLSTTVYCQNVQFLTSDVPFKGTLDPSEDIGLAIEVPIHNDANLFLEVTEGDEFSVSNHHSKPGSVRTYRLVTP